MMETFLFFVAIVIIEIVVLELRRNTICVLTLRKDAFAEGTERTTSGGYSYCAYTGIPYARAPVQNYRFELPEKIPIWNGKKQFNDEADVCVQMSFETLEVIGSENCLFLNIYTATNQHKANNNTPNASNLMPVLFWIHGGSFNIGSSRSDLNKPDYMVEQGIVVVTINYRLGPFGFLSYGNVTENIGLHDQRMALEWIHENIRYFNGDKSRITLSGWSAGSASVSYHMYAKKSKDLFDKVIMMSGNMLNPWAFESDVVTCTYELLAKLNIRNSTHAIEELKAVYADDLILPTLSEKLKINFFGSEQFCFVPTIDDDFVTQPPHIYFDQHSPSNVPILIGSTSLESEWIMSFESSNYKYPNKNRNTSEFICRFLSQIFEHESDSIVVDRFVRNIQRTSDIDYGIFKFIENYVDVTQQENVFVYRFAFDNKFIQSNENVAIIGAGHGDELKYLFKDNILDEDGMRDSSWNGVMMTQRMVTMWTNFIKFGNPTPILDASLLNVTWPPYSTTGGRLSLNIDYDLTTVELLSDNDGAFQLWDCIYQCLYYSECDELNEYLLNIKSIEF